MPDCYHIATMGCQMNERDSETVAGILEALGLVTTDDPAQARVAVVNTCAVREKPEHKVYSRLGSLAQLKQRRPDMIIVVCGCIAQIGVAEIRRRAPYVDIILGPRNLAALGEAVAQALASPCVTVRTDLDECPDESQPAVRAPGLSAFVNITYGCDNFCAYCIVPYTRGREISRPADEILAEVRGLIAEGYREVTLLGQNVNSYRGPSETEEVTDFAQLLRMVGTLEGLWRLRFTPSHPKDLSEEVLRAMAETPSACELLHLPMQAGDDEVLARMGRGYTRAHYESLVARARAIVPGLAVTTDAMVGFPGETEEQFEQTLAAFAAIRYDQAFMFKYSDRPGTRAADMDEKVSEPVKQKRLERLVALQNDTSRAINQAQEGQAFEVLVEGHDARHPQKLRGRTRQNKIMVFEGPPELIGTLTLVTAREGFLWGFVGELATTNKTSQ
jgi:tRNA-2-methylthio-N6-dimethylallyladenosine synthase